MLHHHFFCLQFSATSRKSNCNNQKDLLQQILTVTATLKKKRDISIRISCKKILQQQDQIHSPNKALQYQKKKSLQHCKLFLKHLTGHRNIKKELLQLVNLFRATHKLRPMKLERLVADSHHKWLVQVLGTKKHDGTLERTTCNTSYELSQHHHPKRSSIIGME